MRGQARGQATRIRLRALRDAAELGDRIAELAAEAPGRMRERLLESLQESIARLGGDPAAAPAETASAAGTGAASGNGHGEADALFSGLVQIEIGPLSDFSQLVGFEDAAEAIAATSEISLTRFSQGRATLEMRLKQPVELLRELEERAPFDFRVRDRRSDRVVLDVGE